MEILVIGLAIVVWWLWRAGRRSEGSGAGGQNTSTSRGVRPVTAGLLMAEVDDWVYWRSRGQLMRAPVIRGCADWARGRRVDVLTDDVPPAELLEILQALEAAEADLAQVHNKRR